MQPSKKNQRLHKISEQNVLYLQLLYLNSAVISHYTQDRI